MPKTRLSRWSLWLIIIFFALFILMQIISAVGNAFGQFDSSSLNIFQLLVPALIVPAGFCGIASFVTGLISILKNKERSIFVLFATSIGFLILMFLFGEFLFPH